ncbi:MAG: hypothetical protein IT222_00975 [Crocinitomix sp.]|nr:hypothetical protein [Crocinitomix sp.]
MKKIIMIAAIALLAVACNKNQAAVKKLDGTWKATSVKSTEDGVTVELIGTFVTSYTFVFDGCKLKADEFCNVTSTLVSPFGTETNADLYRVVSDGETIEMKDDASSTTINTATITELTKSDCTLTMSEGTGADLVTTVVVLEKQ